MELQGKTISKKCLIGIIYAISLLIAIHALCFTVMGFDMKYVSSRLGYNYNISGYGIISFASLVSEMGAGLQETLGIEYLKVYSILYILMIIAEVVLVVVAVFKSSWKKELILTIMVAVNLGLSFIYMINGIIVVAGLNESTDIAYTSAFVPFILQSLVFAGYFVVLFKMPKDAVIELSKIFQNKTKTESNIKNDDVEDLMNYKKLLDSGIITQEEFDEKKAKILNK